MTGRVSREVWCAAGLEILRDKGDVAVTVERVAVAVGKTKGSFYHHFADFDAYLAALLERWERELTERPIELASEESGVRARGARLDREVRALDHTLDRAVRAWALRDERARDAMRRVDERRIGYLTELHRERGHSQPRTLAELEYSAFVGAQHIGALADPLHAARLGREMRKALTAVGKGPQASGRGRKSGGR